ncbi:MAG: hypothetical protein KIG47_09290 [Prevotellamassilia sp.]|nr:hypothetical protein [Prevotellamassilia sp.]
MTTKNQRKETLPRDLGRSTEKAEVVNAIFANIMALKEDLRKTPKIRERADRRLALFFFIKFCRAPKALNAGKWK